MEWAGFRYFCLGPSLLGSQQLGQIVKKSGIQPRAAIAHNETLSFAMRVCNPDCSPVGINGSDPAQTPTGFLKITGNYFPVLHFLFE